MWRKTWGTARPPVFPGTDPGIFPAPHVLHHRPVHQSGSRVFHHNDGGIRRIIPNLIDAGIDLLHPIQWTCPGMELRELKRFFGGRIVLHGAMDNQHTLPFGSVEDESREVLAPPENIVAMYRTGYENGRS